VLGKKLGRWWREVAEGGCEAETAYKELVRVIKEAGEQVVGYRRDKPRRRRGEERKLRRLLERRRVVGIKWREAARGGGRMAGRLREEFRKVQIAVGRERRAREVKNRLRGRVRKAAGGRAKDMWRDLKPEREGEGLTVMRTEDGVVTDPEVIKRRVMEHWKELGAEDNISVEEGGGRGEGRECRGGTQEARKGSPRGGAGGYPREGHISGRMRKRGEEA